MSNRIDDDGLRVYASASRVFPHPEDVTINYSLATGRYEVHRRRRPLGKDTNYLLSVAAFGMEARHIAPRRHLEYVRSRILGVGWKRSRPQVQRDIAEAEALLEREPDWIPGLEATVRSRLEDGFLEPYALSRSSV